MISVIIPLYNKKSFIRKALESVLNQSYQDLEIVVVNDGSTDCSLEEAQKVKDSRIRFLSQKNAGVSAARNKGIEEARGEYVAFLDADDIWHNDYLACIADLITKYPNAKMLATCYNKLCDGNILDVTIRNLHFEGEDGIMDKYFEVASCSEPPIWTSAVVIERNAILGIGGFPVGVKAGEDLLTWARLAVKYPVAYSKKVMATYLLPDSDIAQKVPTRRLDIDDPVGDALEQLYNDNDSMGGLKKYLAFWHKMRSVNALGFLDMREVRRESWKAIKWNPLVLKQYIILVLGIMPRSIVYKAYVKYAMKGNH